MKKLFLLLIAFCLPVFGADNVSPAELFPALDELPGGRQHWVQSIPPVEMANGCKVHSATYAYFTKEAQPLFDIPRKNVYSVNIRFHECSGLEEAAVLYDKFAEVGEPERKRYMNVGEKGLLYVIPDDKNPLMGNYYLTALMRNYVMQVHADDGFVLMDISDTVSGRLARLLGIEGSLANGVTLLFAKEGYVNKSEFITFGGDNITYVEISGTVYDQYNHRLPGAAVTVRETGNTVFTDKEGNYTLALSVDDDGESISLFRAAELANTESFPLMSGFYKVDMGYKLQDKVSQTVWQLSVPPGQVGSLSGGRVSGSSLNLSDNVRLGLSGTITKEKIDLTRDCGSSLMGVCRQQFTATFDEGSRMYRGSWSGTGGGGDILIYADTFDIKPLRLKAAEAGYKVKGETIASGKKPQYISITPVKKEHTDFYTASARLLLNIKQTAKGGKGVNRALYLYKVKDDGALEAVAATAPLPLSDKGVQTSIDISTIYRFATAEEYRIGFGPAEKEGLSVQATVSFEVDLASEKSKLNTAGAVQASFVSFSSGDYASNSKIPTADGDSDIELSLNIKAYGGIVKGVEIRSFGDSRQWNTDTASFYPGVAVRKDGASLNGEDGAIEYPLQQLEEKLQLHISKGSASIDKITGFEITLILDNGRVAVPVSGLNAVAP